jgi:hypothetical protein
MALPARVVTFFSASRQVLARIAPQAILEKFEGAVDGLPGDAQVQGDGGDRLPLQALLEDMAIERRKTAEQVFDPIDHLDGFGRIGFVPRYDLEPGIGPGHFSAGVSFVREVLSRAGASLAQG